MRIAFDTNVLVYAEGVNDSDRRERAKTLIRRLSGHELALPVQVSGELFRLMTLKLRRSGAEAYRAVLGWQSLFALQPASTAETLLSAMTLAASHPFHIWDALIVSAAAEARCKLLLSEDMADGFAWNGTTIVNPFRADPHPLLAAALA